MKVKVYTIDQDFDEGTMIGVQHDTVHDQLQLSTEISTFPFIWVPNMEGTISKVSTEDGKELGRYRVSPLGDAASPSRTTVDLNGNCWVGNRGIGTVVKTGQFETGQWEDRNANGVCDTSKDLNNDGDITGSEILPWANDECVLKEVTLFGALGTYTPGETHGYDGSVIPRALAVDGNNNIWAGAYNSMKYYYINGNTGNIIRTVDVSSQGHHPYGAVVDKYGKLWSSSIDSHILKIDPSTDPATLTKISLPGMTCYGIGLDYLGHIFASGWDTNKLARINIVTNMVDWIKEATFLASSRGVVCTADNNVWVANSTGNSVTRYDNDGNFFGKIDVGSTPTGVAVDNKGKVWVCDLGDDAIHRIDPGTNTVDLTKHLLNSAGHYSYSDMTGAVARTITTKLGTWNVIFDGDDMDTPWSNVSWTSYEPAGTLVTTRVRSSNDGLAWSAWEDVTNGVDLASTPNGRYIQTETTLKINSGEDSPILYDLTVKSKEGVPSRGIIFPDDCSIME